MAHVLCKLKKVNVDVVRKMLKDHAPIHAKDGMFLEHVWKNADADEVLFLFRTDNLAHAKKTVLETHANARKQDPKAVVPEVVFLE